MKIVHVIDYFQPELGFQEFFLAKYHQLMGHDVCVVTSDRYFPFINYEQLFNHVLGDRKVGVGKFKERGITVYRLPTLFEYKTFIVIKGLTDQLVKLKPDLVIMHNMVTPTSIMVANAKKKARFKLIYDSHTADFNTNFESSFPRRLYYYIFVKKILKQAILENADNIFSIGEAETDFLEKTYQLDGTKLPVIRLGVDTDIYYPDRKVKMEFKKELGYQTNDWIVLYTGKITPEKEVDMLIKAVSKLKDSAIKLLIVGSADKNFKKKLIGLMKRSKVEQNIKWLEMVPQEELPKYYQVADIAVWPGNPSMARFEALACGLPIIMPDFESTNDVIKKGAGLIFSRGNLKNLVEKIEVLHRNVEKYNEISKNALKIVKNEYSWRKIAEDFLKNS